jgi:rubrerythrin
MTNWPDFGVGGKFEFSKYSIISSGANSPAALKPGAIYHFRIDAKQEMMMRESFVLEDILNALIALEEHGNNLYLDLEKRADSLEARDLFADLAAQERRHREIYAGYKNRLGLSTGIDAEYQDYLVELLRSSMHLEQFDVPSASYDQALAMGIRLEKKTLLFLGELKTILAEKSEEIDELLKEEKRHLHRLLELKRA